MKPGLQLEGLRVFREGVPLVAIDTIVEPGEVLTIMGPSGSGKSTLLSVIIGASVAGFEVQGRVLLDGRDITELPTPARQVGILFQDDILFPHLSVGKNLAFGIKPDVKPRSARLAIVEEALKDADLAGFCDRDPATLSGGQRVRVALLRMLLSEPRVLLLDEPFSRLDAALRTQIRSFVLDRARRRGLPILLVTHDAGDALAAGGRVLSPLGQEIVLVN